MIIPQNENQSLLELCETQKKEITVQREIANVQKSQFADFKDNIYYRLTIDFDAAKARVVELEAIVKEHEVEFVN